MSVSDFLSFSSSELELLSDAGMRSSAWPFREAAILRDRLEKHALSDKDTILFETGYGPSGLPHIGTFGEVVRTAMVRHAFQILTGGYFRTRLIVFSDDMDGLRKVPDNIPNKDKIVPHLGKPLTRIPDPFSTHSSFGAHNNARLCAFLDDHDFDYEFASSTEYYQGGHFDDVLRLMLLHHDRVRDIILPTLGELRRRSYSPFLPICPDSGRVLQAEVLRCDTVSETILYRHPETGREIETSVLGGCVKCQWKADWALRWRMFGIDYEMAGKDLIDSLDLSGKICRILGGVAPAGFAYELFLDDKGEKISKSKGNGLSMEDWLRYGSPESLRYFMFQNPKRARRLYFDVIPRVVDGYFSSLSSYRDEDLDGRLSNPVWHVHGGSPPNLDIPVNFSLLLNLVAAANAGDRETLWGFICRYAPDASPQLMPALDSLVGYAISYFDDFVRPYKRYRLPTDIERRALEDLSSRLAGLPVDSSGETIQGIVYDIGKSHDFSALKDWFRALYEILLGQSQGPRFGPFAALYGIAETRALISDALDGRLAEE